MEFKVEQLTDKSENYFEITLSKDCLKNAKELNQNSKVKISFDDLGLGVKLYGKTKTESIKIQKINCKNVLMFYKRFKRIVKILLKKSMFDGEIFVERLDEKKNNNDMMFVALLDVDFNAKLFSKMKCAYEHSCDFFDAENELNKMCDFHDNHCTKHRDKNIKKTTGCCPGFCKIRVTGKACTHKNLACKIFMCDYLINEKGYYFTPNTLPVLKKHMTALERFVCFGSLCRTEQKSLKHLWFIRSMTALYSVIFIAIIILICL